MGYDVLWQGDMVALAQQVLALQSADWGGGSFSRVFGQPSSARVIDGSLSSGITPAWLAYLYQDDLVILVAGVRNASQAVAVYQSAGQPRILVGAASVSPAIGIVAVQIGTRVLKSAQGGYSRAVLAGHSYGGAIAEVLAAYLAGVAPELPVQVFSTGAPRPGDNTVGAALANATCARIMTEGDPIPHFPCHFDEAPFGVFALGYQTALTWSHYAQGPGGRLVNRMGDLRSAELPPLFVPVVDADLVLWLGAALSGGHPEHNLTTYLARLEKGVPQLAAPVPTDTASLKGETVVPLPQAVFNLGPVTGPLVFVESETMAGEQVYIPPQYRAKAYRIGSQYFVYWMNFPLSQTTSFSRAKSQAKYLNFYLRRVQNGYSFSNAEFLKAATAYFTQASSANAGFQPVLSVEF
jgi:Lipase (class 3)